MVGRLVEEIPAEFRNGIVEVRVSPRTVRHPERPEVWTLGECIPLPLSETDPRHLQSRVVLYYGSFLALARETPDFDWKQEAWDTLTHELRHHMEWKARVAHLEAFDAAVESNFARQAGEPFDPLFYRDGIPRPDGSFQVDDDVFIEQVVEAVPDRLIVAWAGRRYACSPPSELTVPAFLTVLGVADPPPGDLVLVLLRRPGVMDLFRRRRVYQGTVEATPLPDYLSPP